MENKGLSAEQVEELVEWMEDSWTTLECRSITKITDKIRELQQPKKRYVDWDYIKTEINFYDDGLLDGRTRNILDRLLSIFKADSKTLEELKDE